MAKPISNGPTIEELIKFWVESEHPDWSIDTLLCHPRESLRMAKDILETLNRRASPDAIYGVCRAALNGRKRGNLRVRGR